MSGLEELAREMMPLLPELPEEVTPINIILGQKPWAVRVREIVLAYGTGVINSVLCGAFVLKVHGEEGFALFIKNNTYTEEAA